MRGGIEGRIARVLRSPAKVTKFILSDFADDVMLSFVEICDQLESGWSLEFLAGNSDLVIMHWKIAFFV